MLIVGNGFDLEHGLKTTYWDFREYLEENHLDFLIAFEKMYNFYPIDFGDPYVGKDAQRKREETVYNMLWEKFEELMGNPDIGSMINASECILDDLNLDGGNIGIEDTMDDYWENEYGFIQQFPDYVKEWIEQISTDNVKARKKSLINDNECICLNFNYTDTLENVYHIEDRNTNEKSKKCFCDECEWRYVPDVRKLGLQQAIPDYEIPNTGLLTTYSNSMDGVAEVSLCFDYKEIKHIIIPTLDEYRQLVENIDLWELHDEKYDILSKIIVWERSRGDF